MWTFLLRITYYHFPKYCRFLLNHPVYGSIWQIICYIIFDGTWWFTLHSVSFGCNLCMQYPKCLTEIQQWYCYKVTTAVKAQLISFYNSLKFVFIYAFSATIPCQMQDLDFWNVLSHANIRHWDTILSPLTANLWTTINVLTVFIQF